MISQIYSKHKQIKSERLVGTNCLNMRTNIKHIRPKLVSGSLEILSDVERCNVEVAEFGVSQEIFGVGGRGGARAED